MPRHHLQPRCHFKILDRSASKRLTLTAALAVAALGCGSSSVVPVSGRVTLNGQPLVGADVTFQPLRSRDVPRPPGTGSVGRTDTKGKFSLRMVQPDRPGAVVGDHAVSINTLKGGSDAIPPAGQPLPDIWRDGSRTFRVPAGGTTQANFDITITAPPTKKRK
jgi:hypothetical protein